uniref:Polycystin domain-containing protein n=1 Tax=Alexandrium monilatum TaxID=311494 RepID=A0A7S4S6M5_9DINO
MQSDALATRDDDGEEALTDELAEKDLKREIREMQEEKRQRDDYAKRLGRKITKLNAALADVVEEEEGLRRKQEHELNKKDNENASLRREMLARADNQNRRIREYFNDVLYTKPPVSRNKHVDLDTVKVTNSRFQNPLAFRIDETTTVIKLRNNACKYWNVPPDNCILKTMSNNKCSDEIRVKDCFKQGELAQLRLEEKKMEASKPTEEELKAIMPKGKGRKVKRRDPRYNVEGIETIQRHIDGYASQLKKMGGIYFLPKLRDAKPSEHCSKIKLRDMVIYTALIVLTVWVYTSRRPAAEDYWLVRGIEDFFSLQVPKAAPPKTDYTTYVPEFLRVDSQTAMWDWLENTLPSIIWSDTDFSLGDYNMLVGYMAIRVKNVVRPYPPWTKCLDNQDFVKSIGGTCYPERAIGEDEERADFPSLVSYWDTVTQKDRSDPQRIRGDANPAKFASAEQNAEQYGMGSILGSVDSYDAGGYSVQYKMSVPNNTKATAFYLEDMAQLKQVGWISLTSRVVIISFTLYNYDYDMWTANDFLFQIPPSGAVRPHMIARPFKPRLDETRRELTETSIDIARIMIAIYILVFVGMNERRHKIKYHKAGAWYHVSLNGITDFGIVICIWVVVLWRNIGFRGPPVGERLAQVDVKFHSFTDLALTYNNIFCIEGLLMIFLSLRMMSFFRLNHRIYLLWKMLGVGFMSFSFFALMFLPTLIGFIILLHTRFGVYLDKFSSFNMAAVQFYRIVQGQLNMNELVNIDMAWSMVLSVLFFVMIPFMTFNVYAAIVVDAYFITQITAGGPGESWTLNKYYRWAVPSLLVNMIQAITPGQHIETA